MSAISVQLNLTLPQAAAAIDELAPKIWLYANSRHKVNSADLSANHPSSRELIHGRDLGGSSGETQSRD